MARKRGDIPPPPVAADTAEAIREVFIQKLYNHLGRFPEVATDNDNYLALAYTVRDRINRRGIATSETYYREKSRTICYLSAEYLLGPHLARNLLNLGLLDEARRAMTDLGLDFDRIIAQEEEPGLGNGGLGRLAACFMESLATLQTPTIGYGIRYEFGIFDQAIRDGWQVELTDKWLGKGNPWEIARPEIQHEVPFGGHTESFTDGDGRYRVRWVPAHVVKGVGHDTYIHGYRVNTANLLRLWRAQAAESFDFEAFNVGDYWRAVEDKVDSENITKVLYPNDQSMQGKRLRLEQQFFFVSCSLQDMIRIYLQTGNDLTGFSAKYAVQLNDTHPSVAVAELMRLLVDVHGLGWEAAWEVTRKSFAYTNHTLLPEALEKWPVELFGTVLPRHLEIVYEINRRFLEEVRASFPLDEDLSGKVSIIDESPPRYVRMAHLAAVGSYAVNGVAALHTRLLTESVLKEFARMWPERFFNVTNGVTPRRFLALANPSLSALLDRALGPGWLADLERLRELEALAEDPAFREEWRFVKRANKEAFAGVILERTGVVVDPDALFDVQVKRIHEYKRQHLNILHVIALHRRLRRNPDDPAPPRVVLFAGKAAPGYRMAKLIIKLIHCVADKVNADPEMKGRLKVAFLPDYNVKNAMPIFPAADLSEQISTAGMEASGTGNMKLALNGALTIGTLDGANVEIREAVWPENFFLFGLTAEEVEDLRRSCYRPRDRYLSNPALAEAIDLVASGAYSNGDGSLFEPLVGPLLDHDPYLVLEDFADYLRSQGEVERAYGDPENWSRMSILNVARSGYFSSDRAIAEYCREIWKIGPVEVRLEETVTSEK